MFAHILLTSGLGSSRYPDLISGSGFCRRCLHQTPIEGQTSVHPGVLSGHTDGDGAQVLRHAAYLSTEGPQARALPRAGRALGQDKPRADHRHELAGR
jgi:hypothetical protein